MWRSTRTRLTSRSASFYAALLLVVGPIYAIAPFAWALVTYALWKGAVWSYTLPGKAVFLWAVFEVMFSIFHFAIARRISASPPRPPSDPHQMRAAFSCVLKVGLANHIEQDRSSFPHLGFDKSLTQLDFHDSRAQDFREYMRTWFHRKPWSQIHTHEMRQWIYWSIFNAHLPPDYKLSSVDRAVLEESMVMIQQRAGDSIKQGSNPECRPLLLTLDPVTIHPRPLVFYALICGMNRWLIWTFQHEWGLHYGKCGDLEYLVRLPRRAAFPPMPRPLIFIHGLGMGLLQYNTVLRSLLHMIPSHPILIPLQPHISQDIFHPRFFNPLPRLESVRCLTQVIKELGWIDQGVDMLSHSNGSFFHAWMLKSCPEIIKRSCFVDPVAFCSWEGDVCYNFVYRPCMTSVELLMRYFVGTELGVANVIQRHFNWSENSLWYDEIPNASDPSKAAFFLGGQDAIVDSERVRRYLSSHGVDKGVWFDPKGRHGQALISGGEGMQRVITWLLEGA